MIPSIFVGSFVTVVTGSTAGAGFVGGVSCVLFSSDEVRLKFIVSCDEVVLLSMSDSLLAVVGGSETVNDTICTDDLPTTKGSLTGCSSSFPASLPLSLVSSVNIGSTTLCCDTGDSLPPTTAVGVAIVLLLSLFRLSILSDEVSSLTLDSCLCIVDLGYI